MSLIAEYRLWSPQLPLMGPLATVPDMTLTVENEYAETPREPTIFLWAEGDDFDAFEAEVETDDSVRSLTVLDRLDSQRLYRIQISAAAEVVMYPAALEVGASQLAVSATHQGLDVRQRFPDHGALRQYREHCRERDVSFSLQRLYSLDRDGPTFDTTYGLSAKQCRTLQVATETGYFDVPRTAQLDDLATELDISSQSVSERLRRGTARLVQRTLSGETGDPTARDE